MSAKGRLFGFYLLGAVATSGCSVGPEYARVAPDLPPQYSESAVAGESVANIPFWSFFQSEELNDLIRTGLNNNRDLAGAMARIEEARARVGFVRADQFPNLDLSGDASRNDPSDVRSSTFGTPFNNFFLGTDLTFELDLWGKLRRATEAERAELLASEFGYRAVTLTLVSDIASTYFLLLDLDNRVAIAERTLENRKNATGLITSRFKGGIVPELDVHQAQIEESEAAASLAQFQRSRNLAENALNLLLGRAPQPIARTTKLSRDIIAKDIPLGFPGELLERRPDVVAAEQRTRAQFERIGVAEAQRLPSLSLLGTIGLNSNDLTDFLDQRAFTWNIGGGLLGPLLDWGRSRSRVEIAKAQADQALSEYQQSVLIAVREVEDSVTSLKTYKAENDAREMQRKAASDAARLAWARYNDGVTNYLEVLDIERSLFDAELAVSATYQSYLTSIVRLYAALGGGWQKEKDK